MCWNLKNEWNNLIGWFSNFSSKLRPCVCVFTSKRYKSSDLFVSFHIVWHTVMCIMWSVFEAENPFVVYRHSCCQHTYIDEHGALKTHINENVVLVCMEILDTRHVNSKDSKKFCFQKTIFRRQIPCARTFYSNLFKRTVSSVHTNIIVLYLIFILGKTFCT